MRSSIRRGKMNAILARFGLNTKNREKKMAYDGIYNRFVKRFELHPVKKTVK